jgi:hypothetical protein
MFRLIRPIISFGYLDLQNWINSGRFYQLHHLKFPLNWKCFRKSFSERDAEIRLKFEREPYKMNEKDVQIFFKHEITKRKDGFIGELTYFEFYDVEFLKYITKTIDQDLDAKACCKIKTRFGKIKSNIRYDLGNILIEACNYDEILELVKLKPILTSQSINHRLEFLHERGEIDLKTLFLEPIIYDSNSESWFNSEQKRGFSWRHSFSFLLSLPSDSMKKEFLNFLKRKEENEENIFFKIFEYLICEPLLSKMPKLSHFPVAFIYEMTRTSQNLLPYLDKIDFLLYEAISKFKFPWYIVRPIISYLFRFKRYELAKKIFEILKINAELKKTSLSAILRVGNERLPIPLLILYYQVFDIKDIQQTSDLKIQRFKYFNPHYELPKMDSSYNLEPKIN